MDITKKYSYKTEEGLKKLIELGYTCKDICSLYNTKDTNIRYYCNKYNLKFNERHHLTKQEEQQILMAIKEENMTYDDISKKYNISISNIRKALKKHNLSKGTCKKSQNKFNENYFEIINNERKAYWIGFFMADGCVTKTSKNCKKANRLSINISNKDRYLLEEFCKDICYDENHIKDYIPNGTYSQNLMSKVCLDSTKLCNDLAKHGIIPSKTGKEIIPETIPREYIHHFVRGFFDGDGYYTREGRVLGFCSNLNFLESLQNVFIEFELLDMSEKRPYKHETRNNGLLYYLQYHRKSVVSNISNFMYNDATIFLQRKKDKFYN